MPITYKCPNCGAALAFDSQTQKLSCAQCGFKQDVHEYERILQTSAGNPETDYTGTEQTAGNTTQEHNANVQEPEMMNVKIYHCQSCGAELMSDEFTSAVMCSFCGNPSLVEDRLQGAYKPQQIIPFKIDREGAKQIYKRWTKKGKLTPSTLYSNSTIEKISGIYVPFWLYDYNAESYMTANANIIRTSRRGNTEYTYTDHYSVIRDVESNFARIPADASLKMNDEAMDKMEPYDYSALEPFAMPYLSGYLSERYNFTSQQMLQRVGVRVNKYITQLARNTIKGYDVVNVLNNNVRMNNTYCSYVLLPVWVLNCRYNNKDFQFMLNGQTGKIVAERPISKTKALVYGLSIFAGSLLIMMLGGLLIW